MDVPVLDLLVGILAMLCAAMLVWGGWLCVDGNSEERPNVWIEAL